MGNGVTGSTKEFGSFSEGSNPSSPTCKQCGKNCESKFCSRSCSAKYNNSRRPPRTKESRDKTARSLREVNIALLEDTPCVVCGGNFTRRVCRKQVCCGRSCSSKQAFVTWRKSGKKWPLHPNSFRLAGRAKVGRYKGIYVNSTYELVFLMYHQSKGSNIIRSKKKFRYFYEDKERLYSPDFEVEGILHEVKGYVTEKDLAKFASINEKLVIVKKKEIDRMKSEISEIASMGYEKLPSLYDDCNPDTKCEFCEKLFYSIGKRRFCSRSCNGKAQKSRLLVDGEITRFHAGHTKSRKKKNLLE